MTPLLTPLPPPLPPPLGPTPKTLGAWTLVAERHFATWATGTGAALVGGRWNSPGQYVLYAALDPATAILEVAVHKGFRTLDTVPHRLVHFSIDDPALVHAITPDAVPNPNWLAPGVPSAGQQQFGDALLAAHPALLVPSVVSRHSWNLVLHAGAVAPHLSPVSDERFALDTRLHPPAAR